MRTVTVGYRRKDAREPSLPYVSKALEEITLGIQRVAVICPSEDQVMDTGADVEIEGRDAVVPVLSDGQDIAVSEMSEGRDVNVLQMSDVVDEKARGVSGFLDGVGREVSDARVGYDDYNMMMLILMINDLMMISLWLFANY